MRMDTYERAENNRNTDDKTCDATTGKKQHQVLAHMTVPRQRWYWLFFLSFTYLFGCTGVLVGTLSIFSCGMWDLVPWLGIEPRFPASPFVCLWGCCLDSQFRRGTKWNRNSSSFSPMHQTNTFRMEQRRILSRIKGINCPWLSWGKKIKLIEWWCCCYY